MKLVFLTKIDYNAICETKADIWISDYFLKDNFYLHLRKLAYKKSTAGSVLLIQYKPDQLVFLKSINLQEVCSAITITRGVQRP